MARPAKSCGRSIRGFTLPEVLVVIGVIALLIAILLPAISGAMRTGDMASAMNNMKQINTWMNLYSTDNRDYVLPSQFNYTNPSGGGGPAGGFPIKVRSDSGLGPLQYKGTWTDILWTYNELGSQSLRWAGMGPGDEQKYLYDSPDKPVYEEMDDLETPFRSPVRNTRDLPAADGTAKPFGLGAHEASLPGFFAANNFFNSDRDAPAYTAPGDPPPPPMPTIGRWYVNSQIKAPSRSMYLTDSLAGETIGPWAVPFDNQNDATPANGIPDTLEADFRYNGVCLMLFLDGHVAPQSPWTNLDDLQNNKRVKINHLDKN